MGALTGRQRLLWGLVALLLLPVAFLAAPPGAPPLYNGLGFPDEPYRHLGAAAGRAPGRAVVQVAGTDVGSAGAYAGTPERPPQAAFVLPPEGVEVSRGGSARLVVEPVAVPEPRTDGTLLSNAYLVQATAEQSQRLRLVQDAQAVVQLRVPAATDERVAVEFHDGRRWTNLPTRRTGEHVYSAFLPSFGIVAAVLVRPSLSVEHGRLLDGTGTA